MMIRRNVWRFLVPLVLLGLGGCVEEIPIETDEESIRQAGRALVVEATLTDQVRTQKVVLSRVADFTNDSIVAFDIEDPGTYLFPGQELSPRPVLYESGALISVEDDAGQTYSFVEGEPGRYFSATPFGAESGRAYQLQIVLRSGERVVSDFESIAGTTELANLQVRRLTDPVLGDGIGFFVDSRSASGGAAYFRYTFEETFKVIAPLWNPEEFLLSYYDPCADPVEYTLEIVRREQEEQVCYRTLDSDEIVLASTEGLTGGEVRNFRVHFIARSDFKIAHRYSILLKQHTENLGSYLFYDRLSNFSRQGNVFSQVQPGFLQGNLRAGEGSDLMVIGYFSVDTAQEQRLFLNFEDYFPGEPEPPFVVPCFIRSSPESHATRCPVIPVQGGGSLCPLSVIELLDLGRIITYAGPYDENIGAQCPGPHAFVPRVCGDCTVLGVNVPPDFWTEN